MLQLQTYKFVYSVDNCDLVILPKPWQQCNAHHCPYLQVVEGCKNATNIPSPKNAEESSGCHQWHEHPPFQMCLLGTAIRRNSMLLLSSYQWNAYTSSYTIHLHYILQHVPNKHIYVIDRYAFKHFVNNITWQNNTYPTRTSEQISFLVFVISQYNHLRVSNNPLMWKQSPRVNNLVREKKNIKRLCKTNCNIFTKLKW